jgi:hypothetical protein
MPATYRLDLKNRVVWSHAWGTLTDEELQAHSRTLTADPRFEPSFRQLQDLTDVGYPRVTTDGLRILARMNPFRKNARRAVLVATDLIFGLARMHEQLREGSEDELQVFQDQAAALAWLSLPPSWTPPEASPADPRFQSR